MTAAATFAYQPKNMIHALLMTTVVLFGMYMYFVSASVVHVVMRTETERSIQQLRSDINVLESDYIAAQHRVSEHISMLEGYNEVTAKTFIDRQAPSLVLGTTR